MHERIRALNEIGPLREPVLLAALVGWTDAHGAAASVIEYLADQWDARPLADIDPEPFYDFTVQRPRSRNRGGDRVIDWPANRFLVASPPGSNRDFLLFYGIEPHLRWRTFLDAVVDVLDATGTTMSVTMGAQPGSVPHTRPLPVSLSASDDRFERQFGLRVPVSRYEGPTGLLSVLNLRLRVLEQRNASLWVQVPHYINSGPNPSAMVSLLRTLDRGFGTATPVEPLDERLQDFDERIREALDQMRDGENYVRSLEEKYDGLRWDDPELDEKDDGTPLLTSDEILGDLERFLREQRGEPGGAV